MNCSRTRSEICDDRSRSAEIASRSASGRTGSVTAGPGSRPSSRPTRKLTGRPVCPPLESGATWRQPGRGPLPMTTSSSVRLASQSSISLAVAPGCRPTQCSISEISATSRFLALLSNCPLETASVSRNTRARVSTSLAVSAGESSQSASRVANSASTCSRASRSSRRLRASASSTSGSSSASRRWPAKVASSARSTSRRTSCTRLATSATRKPSWSCRSSRTRPACVTG